MERGRLPERRIAFQSRILWCKIVLTEESDAASILPLWILGLWRKSRDDFQ